MQREPLRRLPAGQVDPDEPLPAALRTSDGSVLVPAGQRLTLRQIAELWSAHRCEIYTGVAWKDEAEGGASARSPQQIVQALQRNGGRKGGNLRKHERKSWRRALTIQLESAGDEVASRTIAVQTHDLSSSGFAFFCSEPIPEGTTLRARFDMLAHQPSVVGVIRSCVRQGSQHRVGVQFLECVR